MFLDIDTYEELGGTIKDEMVFTRLENKAARFVNILTCNRLSGCNEDTAPDCVKYAVYELIEEYNNSETRAREGVASVSNDGVSVSYSRNSLSESQSRARDIVMNHLQGETDAKGEYLLYWGVY